MREPREEAPLPPVPTGLRAALTLTVFATIYLGILRDAFSSTPRARRRNYCVN